MGAALDSHLAHLSTAQPRPRLLTTGLGLGFGGVRLFSPSIVGHLRAWLSTALKKDGVENIWSAQSNKVTSISVAAAHISKPKSAYMPLRSGVALSKSENLRPNM